MLIKIGDSGRAISLKKIPYEDSFLKWINLIDPKDYAEICTYIDEKIEQQDKFSVATLFGGDWDNPLIRIYAAVNEDSYNSALLLGRINLDRVIRSETEWFCTKTHLNGRDLATTFYWRKS